jgi:tetratricopeptide (TPR) repeat protein
MAGKIIPAREGGSMRKVLLITAIGCVTGSAALWAQAPAAPPKVDKASAYYHYTLAHMYAEQASMFGNRGDFVNKAIENYKEAIKADPTAAMLSEELSDLYVQSGRLREAQTDAEDVLKQNPNDLNAHRLLARIFTRLVGDGRSGKVDENMLRRATDQYQKITQLAPKDVPAWLMLARLQKAADNSVDAQKSYQKVLDIDPDNEDALTGLALVYSDLGDNRKAAELLKLLADKNPTPRSLTALAAAYEQMRDFKGAAGVLRKLLETNPANEREVQRNLAQDLMLSQDYAAALEVYNQLVTDDPADAQSYLRISQIYRQERDFTKAREANDKAKAVEPNSIEIRYNEVNILEAEDRTTEATQLLKEILDSTTKRNYNQAERGNRTALLERLAGLYRSMDQTDQAIDAYRQEADVDPMQAQRSSAKVIDAYRTGKEFAKAQQEADAAIKKWPDDRMIRMTRDSMLAEMGKIDEASADLKKMLSGKDDRDIYVSLANTYEKGKRWDDMGKALDAAEKLSDSAEDKSGIWFMRGAMLERMKKLDKAEVEFRKVLKADPDNAGAMNYIGYMLADANLRLEESLDLITKALDIEPGNGAYLDSLGWVQFRLGRLEDAEKNLRRALDKTPRDPTVHDHMADILMKESKVKEAVAQWETSIKEWDTSSPTDLDPTEIAQVKRKLEAARVRLAREVPRQ